MLQCRASNGSLLLSPIFSVLVAAFVAIALIFSARHYFNQIQRRRKLIEIGIEVLASRSWKDGIDLLTKALSVEGARVEGLVGDKGVPLPERLIRQAAGSSLLVYKHGTAYRIAASALADAQRRREEVGADTLCIATLGQIDPAAVQQAERDGIRLFDGAALWALIEPFIEESVRKDVAREADEAVKRPRTLATAAAALLGAGIVVLHLPTPRPDPTPAPTAPIPASPAGSPPTAATEAAAEPADANAQREVRRAALASAMIDLTGVESAAWSSNTTLVIDLLPGATVDGVFTASCGLAAQYPELRDEVRLQFESDDPAEGVRWRRCG